APSAVTALGVGSEAETDAASVRTLVAGLPAQFGRYPTLLGFYVGKNDPTFVSDNMRLDRELSKARVSHVFELYPGGHTSVLWQSHAVQWLQLALGRLHAATA